MTPIEIMALIVIVVAVIKLIVILVKPKAWIGVVKSVYSNSVLTMVVSLVLAVIVLNYLLTELTIVQIFASMLFFALLAALSISVYSKDLISLGNKMLKDRKFLSKAWLAIVVWIILIIWAVKELFFI